MIIVQPDSAWLDVFGKPLRERHGPAPAAAIDHVRKVNSHRIGLRAAASVPDAHELATLQLVLDDIPAAVKARLADTFLGVYFAEGLGSSAVTDIVISEKSEFLGIVTLLDVSALSGRGANAWLTWRERSPFHTDAGIALDVRIAADTDDTDNDMRHAMRFLLLHELGHALSAGRGFLLDWWAQLPAQANDTDYTFLPICWHIDDSRHIVPLAANDFPQRAGLAYYGSGPQFPAQQMIDAYAALLQTGFPTMYAALDVYEDFAESFACYVHVVLLEQPLSVQIRRHGDVILDWHMDWKAPRFALKYTFFQRLLGVPA